MADSGFERFQVQQQLLAMPEHQRLRKLDELSTSIWVFEQNYRELLTRMTQTLSLEASLPLTVRKNRMLFEFSVYELTRLLHNFVASAVSLVDHTRRIYRTHYDKKGLFPEYQAQVDKYFANCSLAQFVVYLRHFVTHYELPGIALQTRVLDLKTERMAHALIIPKKNLLTEGFDWSAKAKEYIDGCAGDYIDLLCTTDNYHTLVVNFHHWFKAKQREIHREDYAVVSRAQEEYLRRSASEVEEAISERLELLAKGLGSIFTVIGVFLSREQDAEIAHLMARPTEWTKAALAKIQENVPLSSQLTEKIMHSVAPPTQAQQRATA